MVIPVPNFKGTEGRAAELRSTHMATSDRVHRPRWQVRTAAAALTALAGLCLTTGSADAATLEAAGWWSTTSSPLPVNPTAPGVTAEQLHVQGDPSGPTAVAAIRWALAEGESSPVLTLTPSSNSFLPPGAVLVACPATAPWQEANGGAMTEAPASDCATPATGTIAADGSSIEFDLSPLVKGTSLDVVLQPGAGSTFSLTFDRPAPEALVTTSGSATASEPVSTSEPSTSTGSETSTAPSSTSSDSSSTAPATSTGSASSSFASPVSTGSTSFSVPTPAPPTAAMPAEASTQAAPAAGTAAGTGTGTGNGAAAASPAKASDSGANDRAKKLGAVVLLAGLAVLGWAWTATDPSGMGKLKAAVASRPLLTRRPVTQQ